MLTTQITTHVEDALLRLLQQDKDSPLFTGFVAAFVEEFQNLENVLIDLRDSRSIALSSGATLDRVAGIVGVVRELGESDANLRIRINIAIVSNRSKGTPESIIEAALLITPLGTIQLIEYDNAAFSLTIFGITLTQDEIDGLHAIIRKVKLAGVNFEFIALAPDPDDTYFSFDGNETTGMGGFGDSTDLTQGGKWAELAVES